MVSKILGEILTKMTHGTRSKLSAFVVDLDGTLIVGDSLFENLLIVLKKKPWVIFKLVFWLFEGRAVFKHKIAQLEVPDPSAYAYRQALVRLIQEKKRLGAQIILATAADRAIGKSVANHLQCFDDVISSDKALNLKGEEKLQRILELLDGTPFDYAGNDISDVPMWRRSRVAYLVGDGCKFQNKLEPNKEIRVVDPTAPLSPKTLLKAMRVHQWPKNTLVFVPLILAHQLAFDSSLLKAVIAFFAFSLTASATYIWNDLFDLHFDRKHPTKHDRPIASGALKGSFGLLLSFALLAAAVAMTMISLPPLSLLMIAGYVGLTLTYSLYLRKKLYLDVLFLAGFYGYRLLFGGVSCTISVSPWLIAFSLFFFLSLANIKRYSELVKLDESISDNVSNRSYRREDVPMIGIFGSTSGYLSILVLALYINSPDVSANYGTPSFLWLMCPLLLYWISRIWLLAHRRELDDDPVLFALKDRHSYYLLISLVFVFMLSSTEI